MRRLSASTPAVVASAVVLAALAAAPGSSAAQQPAGADTAAAPAADTTGPAAGQEAGRETGGRAFLGGYALLAHDPTAGQIGVVAASSRFSAGSGLVAVEAGRGAVAVLGHPAGAARRAASGALRDGAGAGEVTARALSASGRAGGMHVTALTPGCERSTRTAEGAHAWTGSVEGRESDVCFVATGAFLADSTVAARLAAAFRDAEGTLVERLQAAFTAAEAAPGDVGRSRSAALWISAPDAESGALGRADLRLQVEDSQRPADALRLLIRGGRADHLAHRASRAVDAGDHDRAVELADRATELDPATSLAWMARGRALLYQGEDDEAEEAFRRMLEVDPHLLHLLGDPRGAVRDTADGGRRGTPEVRRELIPYRPRLILRLDEYRRAFHRKMDFPSREPDGAEDGSGGGLDGGGGPGAVSGGGDRE